ncbi:MAG TPA: hypothetical protein VL992_12190 [Tepidisphaeraceae bacterium]|nr:hypothetical protein [Tepidisphaeraceae bacterium]
MPRLKLLRGQAHLEAVWALMEQSAAADRGEEKIEWLKMALRAAWKEARFDFTLRAFTEMRKMYELDSRYVDLGKDILWYFKWLAEELPQYADVSKQQIELTFQEMERFYHDCRESLRPVFALRCQAAVQMGNQDEAQQWYEKWQAIPRGKTDDCLACDLARHAYYLFDRQQTNEAMSVAQTIFRDRVFCDDTPELITRMIGPLLKTGRRPGALAMLRICRRPVRKVPSMLGALAANVVLWFMVGDVVRSRRLAILTLRRASAARNDLDRFSAYRSCGLWAAMAFLAGQQQLTLPGRLMPGPAISTPTVNLADAAALCFDEASRIAAKLDARNGTTRYADRINEIENTIRRAVKRPESLRG